MSIVSIGQRIKHRRKELGLNQPDIAKSLRITKGAISQWESDVSKPKGENLIMLCKVLKITPDYLLYGEDCNKGDFLRRGLFPSSPISCSETGIHKDFGYISIISWPQAVNTDVVKGINTEKHEKVACYKKHSKYTYALRVMGDSMATDVGMYSFPEGVIVVVDPEQRKEATNGIFVIAKENNDNAVIFRQLKYDGSATYLRPLNASHKKIFSAFEVLGKVIDIKIDLP